MMETEIDKVEEETVTSGAIDQGIIKTDIKDTPLEEGFVNIAVDIDKYFNMTEDPLSQYQREVNNEEYATLASARQELITALQLNENTLVERFLVEDKPLVEYAKSIKAINIVEGKLTEEITHHLAGRLFTEMVFAEASEPSEDMYSKVVEACNKVGIKEFSVESVLKEMLLNGDL